MAFTPDWQYNVGGYLTAAQKIKNAKAISYYLLNTYNFLYEAKAASVLAWIEYLSLINPGCIDNGSYSSQSGRGFLLWPQSVINTYALDTGMPWYNGRMQLGLLEYDAGTRWAASQYNPSWSYWKQTGYSTDDATINWAVNDFYYYYLRQFIINIPEASYGPDLSDEMRSALESIAKKWLEYIYKWELNEWSDEAPAWLLFAFNQKKGGRKLIL